MELNNLMQNNTNNRRDERRSGSDRRLTAIEMEFPFIDSHGNLVTYERRKHDRRSSKAKASKQKSYA